MTVCITPAPAMLANRTNLAASRQVRRPLLSIPPSARSLSRRPPILSVGTCAVSTASAPRTSGWEYWQVTVERHISQEESSRTVTIKNPSRFVPVIINPDSRHDGHGDRSRTKFTAHQICHRRGLPTAMRRIRRLCVSYVTTFCQTSRIACEE
jgi:hypothetical protein